MNTIIMTKAEYALVTKHKGNDGPRTGLDQIFIEKPYIIATDGKRLLKYSPGNAESWTLENGAYLIMGCVNGPTKSLVFVTLAASDIPFPGYKSVLRTEEPEAGSIVIDKDPLSVTRAVLEIHQLTGRAVNFEFFRDLYFGISESWTVYAAPDTAEKPIFLSLDNSQRGNIAQAVLLPFKCTAK